MIVGQSIYQLAVMIVLNSAGSRMLGYTDPEELQTYQTLVFNTFVWMQFFNLYK
jgi:Ca2+-transporting ATPase